jgi:hypothetical protein
MKFYIWVFVFEDLIKIGASSKSDKNKEYFTWRPMYIHDKTSLGYSYKEKLKKKKL